MNLKIKFLEGEKWWGGSVADGWKMPLTEQSEYMLDCSVNRTYNQFNGLFVSTKGRYVFFEGGGKIIASNGELYFDDLQGEPTLGDGYGTLKNAYCAAVKKHFNTEEKNFNNIFAKPLYCTWAEMLMNPTQKKILNYADSIIDADLPKSCIIIDDGWMKNYGDWVFDERKFANPKEMICQLHQKGFLVMLWVVPFVNENSLAYDLLKKKGALLCDSQGNVQKVEWWNGISAVLDLSKDVALEWITEILDGLKNKYGIDCFKFDAGDAMYYEFDENTGIGNQQSMYWAKLANRYPGSELRACMGMGGEPIMQRLSDKRNNFSKEGLGGLVDGVIQAGLCGYPYVCADMIGGGQISDFQNGNSANKEFFVRSVQMATFFPIMQFSYAIWNMKQEIQDVLKSCCTIRKRIEPYIQKLMLEATLTAEPIVRPLEYEFPDCDEETAQRTFLIGDRYLVVRTVEENFNKCMIILPQGTSWERNNGMVYNPGEEVVVFVGLNEVCFFERRNYNL